MRRTGTRGTRASVIVGGAVAATIAACAGCAGDPTAAAPRSQARGVPPDTSALVVTVDGAPLFALVDEGAVTDTAARRRLALSRAEPTAAAVRVVRLVEGAYTLLTVGRAVAFDVHPTRRLVYLGAQRTVNASGSISWGGALQGGMFGDALLVASEAGVTGTLRTPLRDGAIYAIRPLGGGFHAITYVDYTKFGVD